MFVDRNDERIFMSQDGKLNIIALLLLMHLEIKAVIVPEHAEISAIKDKIKAEWLTSMLQKSSINFFPITLCNT